MGKLTFVATCIWKAEMHEDLHLTHLFHATLQHLWHPLLKTEKKLPPSFSNNHTSSTKRKQSEDMKLRMAPILEFYPTLLCSLFVMTSFTCCIPQSCLLVLNCLHTFFALHSSAWNHPTC
jgi:hypothetical protein